MVSPLDFFVLLLHNQGLRIRDIAASRLLHCMSELSTEVLYIATIELMR